MIHIIEQFEQFDEVDEKSKISLTIKSQFMVTERLEVLTENFWVKTFHWKMFGEESSVKTNQEDNLANPKGGNKSF